MEDIPNLKNKYNHLLKCTFVCHKQTLLQKVKQDFAVKQTGNKISQNQKCIIYSHGLGSNRIEGFSILPHLPKGYSLMVFDFSGSGKSEGDFTTYGLRQKQDIEAILTYLYKHKNIKEFIIWGRSMGAVASLLFNNNIDQKQTQTSRPQQKSQCQQNSMSIQTIFKSVKCIIADSPFCSFEQISKDIALKKMSIPPFFTEIALKFLEKSFDKLLHDEKTKKNFTPFQIDFKKNALRPVVPIIFVYSLNDEIVRCQHSEKIIQSIEKNRSRFIQKIIIPECGHNIKRPENALDAIFQKIEKYCLPVNESNLNFELKIVKSSFQNNDQNQIKKFTHQQTKNVRNKSFWNFQEQLSRNNEIEIEQIKRYQSFNPFTSLASDQDQFYANQNLSTHSIVRKNIFHRDSKQRQSKVKDSQTKRKGLSLSSTIQREQNLTNQIKRNHQKSPKNVINLCTSSVRPLSMQNKFFSKKKNQEQLNLSPRKGIAQFNGYLMSMGLQKSGKSRPIIGGTRNRISLGGSKQKKCKIRTDLLKQNSNFGLKQSRLNSSIKIAPERDVAKNDSSKISLADPFSKLFLSQKQSKNDFYQTTDPLYNKIFGKKIIIQSFESEPNLANDEDSDLRRMGSKQSLNTIDVGQLHNDIDETLTSFINNKIEYNIRQYPITIGVFDNFKRVETVGISSRVKNNLKEPRIASQMSMQQGKQSDENVNKLSAIGMPSHISLRPSSRFYHEKMRKKLQAQTQVFNKQLQTVKITNQRYLLDE